MSGTVLATNIAGALLLPPVNLVLLCAAGLCLRPRWPRAGVAISAGALIVLLVLSTCAGALLFVSPLEQRTTPLASPRDAGAQAIVALGGGRMKSAPEYGGKDGPSHVALARLRYAATLHRETGLPVLVTGGVPDASAESEAAGMARSLRDDFGVPVQWLEERSSNTAENAAFSARILKGAGVKRILLVTDAMHMPRSKAIFEAAGLEVAAAPTVFFSRERLTPLDFIPTGEGLRRTHYAMHEWVGLVWYRLRHESAVKAASAA
ncbi:YdcF family protein [Noviherbaspirillum cavernae]|uniref:YdcF family protein n=1 Tax=Noviherbaspirillum cavernae TaxID=2320862 RepID=A0A418X2I7_9BURK|nr:YdcF family protein [Noviherbaspirillum cavernae]RJG06644.1 YdcF family protein [Noviherbaspirillum cavernae]